MKRWIIALLFAGVAYAHRIDEYLQATILTLESNRVEASMRLIPGILVSPVVIAGIDRNGDGVFSESEQRVYCERVLSDLSIAIDGKVVQPRLVSWSFPPPAQMREGLGEIHIEYAIEAPRGGSNLLTIANHHLSSSSVYLMNTLVPQQPGVRIVSQKRNEWQSVYEVAYETGNSTIWASVQVFFSGVQFSTLFRLGMRHIAEGTDHLLFLLVLLLPAPLLAAGGVWGRATGVRQSLLRILGIVTAFTMGHSITLTMAALGAVNVPSGTVEALIALSIFISAVHAFRPLFPGKEAFIAGFFGLIHGLAFAATLGRLGLGRWERLAGILAFNLGIETMQLIVVAAALPSLMVMSRSRAYPIFRFSGALFAGTASLGWMAQRILHIDVGVDKIVDVFSRHGLFIAVNLLAVSVACRWLPSIRRSGALVSLER